jgi:hypothetical protein
MGTELQATGAVVLVKVDLDWGRDHWDSKHSLPCRVCNTVTKMRDNSDLPCHQSCREDEIARELLGRARALIADERFPTQIQPQARTTEELR